MVWCYGGAASLAEAGYIREADDSKADLGRCLGRPASARLDPRV